MAEPKRARCVNFVPSEEKLLLDLVLKYKDVVECKKTDALTNKQKEDAWERLRGEFNAASGLCPRTVVNLKSKLDNLKRITKKTLQAERCERRATGGGVPKLPTPAEEEKITVFRQIMDVGLDGLKNPYDSNGVRDLEGNQLEETFDLTLDVITEAEFQAPLTDEEYDIDNPLPPRSPSPLLEVSPAKPDWSGGYTPALLKRKVHPSLKSGLVKRTLVNKSTGKGGPPTEAANRIMEMANLLGN